MRQSWEQGRKKHYIQRNKGENTADLVRNYAGGEWNVILEVLKAKRKNKVNKNVNISFKHEGKILFLKNKQKLKRFFY